MTDTSPEAVSHRLREVCRLSDLRPERRLDSKIDLSPEGVASRLREASDLYTLSLQLAELGRAITRAGESDPHYDHDHDLG